MTDRHYSLLIWVVCFLSWVVVWAPVAVHLSMTWYRGRTRVFKQLGPNEIRLYYEYFSPGALPPAGESATAFEKQFARLYGRRRYIIPFALLVLVSGCGFCACARTLHSWEHLSSRFFASMTPGAFELPKIALAGFLGAFVWVVTDQLQRVRSGDLSQHDVAIAVVRLLVAVPFGYALAPMAATDFGVPLAFLLGSFPTGVLLKFGQRLVTQRLQLGDDESRQGIELEFLQSVSRSNAERFGAEGVLTISELANSDPVDLALRTNQPFDYIIDCAGQAIVWVYFTDKTRALAKYSMRSACEVHWLIERLEGPDPSARQTAETVVAEVATLLEMSPTALRSTLERIAEAPFTRFLVEIGQYRVGPGAHSRGIRRAPVKSASFPRSQGPVTELEPEIIEPLAASPNDSTLSSA